MSTFVLEGANLLAKRDAKGYAMIVQGIASGEDLSVKNERGLRAIDVLARGLDSEGSAKAIEAMALTDFAPQMLKGPSSSDLPPMFEAAAKGSPMMLEAFLDLGMPGDSVATSIRLKLVAGTPFHAIVLGFQESRQDDYAQCLQKLITYCPQGIDISDRMRQKPVDLAFRLGAVTGSQTLANALVSYGVDMNARSKIGAEKMMEALITNEEDRTLALAIKAQGQANKIIRELGVDVSSAMPSPSP